MQFEQDHFMAVANVSDTGRLRVAEVDGTTTPNPEHWSSPYTSLLGMALCLGLVCMAGLSVLLVKLIQICRQASGPRAACREFWKCVWLRDFCTGLSENGESTSADTELGEERSHWDPPRYRDALRMQRLDSTTIQGTPPPLYDSIENKKDPDVEGYTNMAFDYPEAISRQVSFEQLSFCALPEVVRTEPSDLIHELSMNPVNIFSDLIETADDHHTYNTTVPSRVRTVRTPVSTTLQSSNNSSMSSDASSPPCHDITPIPTVSEGVTSDANKHPVGMWDRLPSYQDVLSWISGTNL